MTQTLLTRAEDIEAFEAGVAWLNRIRQSLRDWTHSVRSPEGQGGRFCWARQTTRPANAPATKLVLDGMIHFNNEDIITARDRAEGVAWLETMDTGKDQYLDPAIVERKPEDWPGDERFPNPGLLNAMNQYICGPLNYYSGQTGGRKYPPPAGWPQEHEPEKCLPFIKSRDWENNAWSAGSHSMRIARWMTQWYEAGKIPLKTVVEVFQWFYDQQNRETGLWGGADSPVVQRINGTFKLLLLLAEEMRLPMPCANKMIDSVLAELSRPDYAAHAGGCDEYDNWLVIWCALFYTDYRRDDIARMAARRLHDARVHERPDGGLSYYPDVCCSSWCGVDMAPAISQGDAITPTLFGATFNLLVGVMDAYNRVPWMTPRPTEPTINPAIVSRIKERLQL